MHLIVDAHQDLAYNMLSFGRDYTRSAQEIRQAEAGGFPVEVNGDALLGWPEYQAGRVALVFATLFATPRRLAAGEWETQVYTDGDSARRVYAAHLDAYRRLSGEHPDKFRLVTGRRQLADLLAHWRGDSPEGHPVGLVPLMEGAEAVRSLDDLPEWWAGGVRIIGPAWAGNRFCGGTREPAPLSRDGRALLEAMGEIGFTLDLSHMAWEAAVEALDRYEGAIIASHSNALRLIKGSESNRHLTDALIDGIIGRGGVIGVVPFNRFLVNGWKNSDPRSDAPLAMLADQIDYICQRAGAARHVGFGTDFDGGFGWQHVPPEIDTIADLQKLAPLLAERGYNDADVAAIFGGNWLAHLENHLPDA